MIEGWLNVKLVCQKDFVIDDHEAPALGSGKVVGSRGRDRANRPVLLP